MKRGDNSVFSIEDLHILTNNGREVFIQELGSIPTKAINSPLRVDQHPSFSLFCGSDGIWRYKDFSNGDSGSYIDFIKKRYNLEFPEAKEYIRNSVGNTPKDSIKRNIEKIHKETKIEFSDKKFTKRGHQYWNSFCLSEEFLRKDDIYQVKLYTINDKLIKIPDNQDVFAYYSPDEDKVKLLTIGENVKFKWISNLKSSYLWYYYRYT